MAFFDLDDLIGNASVGFAMNSFACFFARGFEQTENSAFVLVEPISQVFHIMIPLRLEVLLVGLYDPFNSQSIYIFE